MSEQLTVAEVFRRYGEAYRQRYRAHMSQDQLKAMWAIERCRTGQLGTAVYHCGKCHQSHGVPRSCGNRHCPACQGDKARQWLRAQLARLLPCPYFLVTFKGARGDPQLCALASAPVLQGDVRCSQRNA